MANHTFRLQYDESSSKGKDMDASWTAYFVQTFDEEEYINIVHDYHNGLYSCVWVDKDLAHEVSNIVIDRMDKSGYTLGIRIQVQETRLTFLNTTLEGGPSKHGKRLEHISMVESQYRFDVGSPKLQQVRNSSFVFWSGSFNSCLVGQKQQIVGWLERQLFESNLLKHDQLHVAMKENKILRNFTEHPIHFPPTSPFEKDMENYSRNEMPAYSDRIFVMGKDVAFDAYTLCSGYTNSAHKPVILAVKIALSDQKDYTGLQDEMIPIETSKRNSQRKSWKKHSSREMVSPVLANTWELSDFDWNPSEPVEERTFRAIHVPSKKDYFIHIIPKESSKINDIEELALLTYIDCPFVQKCHRVFTDVDNVYCILEPCDRDVASFIGEQEFGEEEAKFYVSQVILGIKEMHSQNLLHGNINAQTIKLLENGYVVLSCYKSATLLKNDDYIDPYTPLSSFQKKQIDFYAIGILTFQLMCGIIDKSFDPFKRQISSKAKDFITKLLNKDPNSRLGSKTGCEELMKHPWLSGYNWKGILASQIAPPLLPMSPMKRSQSGETIRIFKNRRSLDSSRSLSQSSDIQATTKRVSSGRFNQLLGDQVDHEVNFSSNQGSTSVGEDMRKRSLGTDLYQNTLQNTSSLGGLDSRQSRGSTDSNGGSSYFLSGEDIKKEAKRLEIIAEILSTEEIYLKSLKVVIHQFYNPLLKILSKEVHQAIFQSLSGIIAVNGTFLTELETTLKKHTDFDAIVAVLHRGAVAFKLYCDYTGKYVSAFEAIEKEKKKNSKFAKFLIKTSDDLTKANQMGDLQSYLILPVQRLPRYKMMFDELLKATPKHEQIQMQKTVDEITQAVGCCDEKTKENEARKEILTIQQKYHLPIKRQTILVQKGQSERIRVIYNGKKTEIIPEYLIAFNDLIIFQYKDKFRLTKFVKFPIDKYTVVKVVTKSPVKAVGLVQGKESLVFVFEYDYTWQKWSKVFPIPPESSNSIFI